MSNLIKYFKDYNHNTKYNDTFNNHEILKKCKDKQLELIKYRTDNCKKSKFKCTVISNIVELIKNDKQFFGEYLIIDSIYEKINKAVFIIRLKSNKRNYLLKLRSKTIDNTNELKIYKLLKNKNS